MTAYEDKLTILSHAGNSTICRAAIIIRDYSILLGLRHYTPDKWKAVSVWTAPGGRCNPGEVIEQALRREVEEEVGISDLAIRDFIGEIPGAKEGDSLPLFYCTTDQEAKLMEPEKFSEWRWVPFDEYFSSSVFAEMNPTAYNLAAAYLIENIWKKHS